MVFAKGGKQAREEAKKALPSFSKTHFFSLADKASCVIRLVDDSPDWIFVPQHGFIPTKGAPKDWKSEGKDGAAAKKWPATMNAVCRKAKNGDDLVFPEHESKCFICDTMRGNPKSKDGKYRPSIKLWARAILRDEVKGTEAMANTINPDTGKPYIKAHEVGKTVGFLDKIIEVQDTDGDGNTVGDPKKVADVVVINMGMKNFFGAFQASFDAYGTVLDRDYRVTRRGEGLETEYDIVPMDPIYTEGPDDQATKFTLEDEEIRAPYLELVDLEKVITEQASDRHYATFFDTTQEIPISNRAKKAKDEGDEDESGTQQEEAPAPGPDAEELAAMRDRMMNLAPAAAPQS
jgi:hypothetical protein